MSHSRFRPRAEKIFLFLLLFLVSGTLRLAAQTGLGVVHGTVADSSKAVLANAKVTLRATATGVVQSVQTTSAGVYYFGAVRPGAYTLTVEFEHFKKWEGTLELAAGQTAAVDPVLQVGAVDTAIEVTGAVPIIETEKGAVSDVKDALRIHELPLNGRQITNLFSLTPGVEGGDSPRTNGMKVGSTDILLDGISMVDRFGGGMASVQPGLDTVQEWRVETAGSDAAFSRPATVSVVTKSGTNEYHGNLFETFRNNFGGLRARQRQDSAAKPPEYIRNEYGGSASGPLVKNKSFWLFSYEGMQLRQQTYAQAQVPNEAIWGGDFSGAQDTSGQHYVIYDPLTTGAGGTRSPFPGNVIPQQRIAPITATMKGISALPSDLGANPWLTPNFKAYYPRTQGNNTQSAKFDQVFSEKDTLSVRFTRSDGNQKQIGGQYGFPPPGCQDCGGSILYTNGLYSVFARENHVFTPTLLNEFQASVNRSPNHLGQLSDSTNWADKLGLPNPFGATGWPSIYTSDWWFNYWGGWDAGNPSDRNLTQYQIEDNVTWIKGQHNFRFGFRGRQELNNVREMQQAQGSHTFGSEWTSLYDAAGQQAVYGTGDGFASMELGLPTYLSNQYNRGYFYFRQKELGLYFQDTWKVNNRLTLNYGLRWDKWTPYSEKFDRMVNFDAAALPATGMQVVTPHGTTMESIPGIPSSVLDSWKARGMSWVTADQAGLPGALTPAVNNDFGPRLGAAYRLTDKFVVRAAYGMYYWAMPLSQILQTSRTNPPLNLRFSLDLTNMNGARFHNALATAPTPDEYVGQVQVATDGIVPLPTTAQPFTPFDLRDWKDDRMQLWNVTLERELGKNNAVRLGYIGNHGSNLEQRWAYNAPISVWNYQAATGLAGDPQNADPRRHNPNWDGQAVRHNGYSNTQSFQAEFQHRASKGLTFQASYTWAHAMTTSDAGGTSPGDAGINSNNGGSGGSFLVPMNGQIMGNPQLSEDQRLRLGYANSDQIPPHHLRWNGVYELPFGKGKRFGNTASGLVNQLIGGWSVAFIGERRSGFWTGVSSSYFLFGDPTLSKGERFNVDINGREQQVYFRGYLDPTTAGGPNAGRLLQLVPANFSQRVLTRLGNDNNRLAQRLADGTMVETDVTDMVNWNARNFFQGPGAWNEDLSVYKTFTVKEKYRLRLTGDFFNFFNHPNDINPDKTTGLLDLSQQANDPRIIQFSARFEF